MSWPPEIKKVPSRYRNPIGKYKIHRDRGCIHCGLCAETCHYYLATGNPEMQPALKVKLLQSVYRSELTGTGAFLSTLTGAQTLDQAMIEKWIDTLFGSCSMCGRCTLNCTVGLPISELVRAGRSALASVNLVPRELQSTVDTAIGTGNNMGIAREEWLDTAQWIEEELASLNNAGLYNRIRTLSSPQGAWLVELAPVTDSQILVQVVADLFAVREIYGQSLLEALIDFLRYKALLLVLDNCEHLIEACA